LSVVCQSRSGPAAARWSGFTEAEHRGGTRSLLGRLQPVVSR
jgi:hypothetical protein